MINGFGTQFVRQAFDQDPTAACLYSALPDADIVTLEWLAVRHRQTHNVWWGHVDAPRPPVMRFQAKAKDLDAHPYYVRTNTVDELLEALGGLP